MALNEFSSVEEATKAMVHKTTTFSPNEVAAQQYEDLYRKVYLKMFPKLKDVYKHINKFTKRY